MLLWFQKIRDIVFHIEFGIHQLFLLIFSNIVNLYLFWLNFFLIRTLLQYYSVMPFLFILGLNELLLGIDLLALNKIWEVSISIRYGQTYKKLPKS